jgi:hypothetical protein
MPDLRQPNIKIQRPGARILDEYTLPLPAADLERSKDQISQIAHLGLK